MKYISTRGQAPSVDFHKLILSGTTPDRGLYVPEASLTVYPVMLQELQRLPYAQVATRLIGPCIGDFPISKLRDACDEAYTAEKFCYVRDGSDPAKIVPTRQLQNNLYLAEVSGGPTLAFKDIAMQLIAPLVIEAMSHFNLDFYSILLATSGDTGSAAIQAFLQYPQVRLYVMAGGAGMSDFQRRQMFGVLEKHIDCMLFPDFDLAQKLMKKVFEDQDFVKEVNLGAVNSVNLVRLLAQMVYAFTTYLDVVDEIGEVVDYVVPSGNFGDAHSVYMAKLWGLPVGNIIVATNENDVLCRAINDGVYARAESVTPTSSPSMDIQVASNFERTLYFALDQDAAKIAALYSQFEETGRFELSEEEHWKLQDAGFIATSAAQAEVKLAIGDTYRETGLLIDSHTGVGIHAAKCCAQPGVKTIIYETAQAAKFPEVVHDAAGQKPAVPAAFAGMGCAPQRFEEIDAMSADQLKTRIRG